MKKQILFLGTVALMLTSCGGSGKSAANEAGSVAADTVAEASAVSAADELITPDLIYAQVKGPVRSVSTEAVSVRSWIGSSALDRSMWM